jgi:Flp pilus assembly pilin Flp
MRLELAAFLKDESEYIVVASGVALAIVTVVLRLRSSVRTMCTAVTTAMK